MKLAPDRERKIQTGVMPGLVPELLLAEALVRIVELLDICLFWISESLSYVRHGGLLHADPSVCSGGLDGYFQSR